MKCYSERLQRLEEKVKKNNSGIFNVTFKDGRKQEMFWTDAIKEVLDEKVIAIDGDENDNTLELLRALMLSE